MTARWPANVILSPDMADVLDGQSGNLHARGNTSPTKRHQSDGVTKWGVRHDGPVNAGDAGGASRFFLTAGYEPWELEWIIANGLTPCGT